MLFAQDVDKMVCHCNKPDCTSDKFFLHGRCHMSSPTNVAITEDGVVCVHCAECNRKISDVAIKEIVPHVTHACVTVSIDKDCKVTILDYSNQELVVATYSMRELVKGQ